MSEIARLKNELNKQSENAQRYADKKSLVAFQGLVVNDGLIASAIQLEQTKQLTRIAESLESLLGKTKCKRCGSPKTPEWKYKEFCSDECIREWGEKLIKKDNLKGEGE